MTEEAGRCTIEEIERGRTLTIGGDERGRTLTIEEIERGVDAQNLGNVVVVTDTGVIAVVHWIGEDRRRSQAAGLEEVCSPGVEGERQGR